MADILPFRAVRYDLSKVKAGEVMTQPYDKITPAMQDEYYAASPYNLVRIILGKPQSTDNGNENVYTRAAACLRQWQAEGVLKRDAEPSLYVYVQRFKVPGSDPSGAEIERRGFIALGRVEDYDRKVVYRHEQTLSKPKADRLNLLQTTQAHCEQIFMLYSDPADEIANLLKKDTPPDIELRDEYGVLHQLWKVSDAATVAAAKAKMADKKLIIADGHHRYETALNYRNQRRQQAKGDAEAPYERVVITFVNMDAPGLVILPTHRVVFGLENFSIFDMVAELRDYFDVEDIGPVSDVTVAVQRLREAGKDGTALLAVTAHSAFLLRARKDVQPAKLKELSPAQRGLDVVQLHKLILEEILGMSEEDIRAQKYLKYIRDAGEAVEDVKKGSAQVAFLMNPVRIEQMRDIAFAGEVMPQKSTDFYPKMLSGLTIYSVETAAQGKAGAR